MFVKQFGDGSHAFFCLHGWSGDHHTFDPLLPFVPDDARLYCADLPGCGVSHEPEQWKLQAITGEVGEALDATNAGRLTLVGNCIGALIGMCAALERPTLVRRLVLIDAFAHWPWYFRIFTAPGWGKHAYNTTFANPVGRWITNRSLARRRTQESDLTAGFATARHDTALNYLSVMREIHSATAFEPLMAPTDIIFGANSFRAVRESAEVWQRMWPWIRVWELPGAGHLPLQEAASLVGNIIFKESHDA